MGLRTSSLWILQLQEAGAEGAFYNVRINLPDIHDEKFKKDISHRANSSKEEAVKLGNEIKDLVLKELG